MRATNIVIMLVVGMAAFGCGPYNVHVDDVKVNGEITHTIKFDVEDLKKFFEAECKQEVPAAEVAECVNAKVGKFLSFMAEGSSGGNTAQ